MIADHMPFDPMYQFLNYKVTHQQFIDGQTNINNTKLSFNYSDTLQQYALLSPPEKLRSELRRLEEAGVRNSMLLKHQSILKKNLQAYASENSINEGGEAFMKATRLFKEYIPHRNKGFSSLNDNDLRQMMDSMINYTRLARSLLMEAVPKTDDQRQAKTANGNNIERFRVQLMKEKEFVDKYIATDKTARPQLFTRR